MRVISFILIVSFLVVGCKSEIKKNSRVDALPYYNEATFTPKWIDKENSELNEFHKISPFQLTNQDGEIVTEKTFSGKIYVADFFFTFCPGICPRMTKNMGGLQEEFLENKDVLFLSHSVTPRRDSVSVLKAYANEKGVISGKWHLVTGEQQQIYKLGRRDYFVEEDLGIDRDLDEFLHTENFVLIDQNLHIRGIYNGLNKASLKNLSNDIKTLLIE